jgi:alkylhydroperoxidase/carboxymuconolactone decarboxylase family protein YurZ
MPSTKAIDWKWRSSRLACLLGAAMLASGPGQMAFAYEGAAMNVKSNGGSTTELDTRQQTIIPISASAAAGNMDILRGALNQGLDAGLSLAEAREILVQVYAYAGFPRSLNALSELMKVAEARRQRGIQDEAGREPGKPIPKGDALLAAGTANQTQLVGGPVSGPLFDFAPQANEYLRTHLFGDIFERDNLDWQSRELATVSMLAAMSGVEPQLQSHIAISMNIGVRPEQLSSLADVLEARFDLEAAERVRVGIQRQLEARQE